MEYLDEADRSHKSVRNNITENSFPFLTHSNVIWNTFMIQQQLTNILNQVEKTPKTNAFLSLKGVIRVSNPTNDIKALFKLLNQDHLFN